MRQDCIRILIQMLQDCEANAADQLHRQTGAGDRRKTDGRHWKHIQRIS